MITLNSYLRFLSESNGADERLEKDPRFYLSVHFDHFVLLNAEAYWRNKGYASQTIQSHILTLGIVVEFAAGEGLTSVKEFIRPQLVYKRDTERYEAYTDEEISRIRPVIAEAVNFAVRISKGYRRTGVGRDPRGSAGYASHDKTSGWKNWDNFVWYFENVLKCKAQMADIRMKHATFFKAAKDYYGGTRAVWERFNVMPATNAAFIAPLVIKLALETGLNAESIFNLKRDCYQEAHPLTGLPFLRYYKERSTGDKELHLMSRQSGIVRRTIELILKVTEPLVEKASEEYKNYLFLIHNAKNNPDKNLKAGQIVRVTGKRLIHALLIIRQKINETGDDIGNLNLVRFRATKITQMMKEGYDFFQIQAVAGHSRLQTTIQYVNSRQMSLQARKEISAALTQIHSTVQKESSSSRYITSDTSQEEGAVYKGVMSDCKDVYDPPEFIQKLPGYKRGQACTHWNMCLLCQNILITRRHLPGLVTYYNEIKASFEEGNLGQAPNARHYRKIIDVLEELFRGCPEEAMEWAQSVAIGNDTFRDGVTYKGVLNGE